ncbi:uncharacterized protein LOC116351626, partial [Contarinia nasturtii]|uniref:uncharacterized protein LOC116351626 n=1 Tax=Contarinia nasturtii TaxID=265458 RepID=UPI0012D4C0B2
EQLFFIRGSNYSKPEVIDAFLKDFHIDLPIFGYYSTIKKRPDYLEPILNEIRQYYFNSAKDDHSRFIQRLILDSDINYFYFLEKWMERHVAISKKDTFYSRFSVSTKINPHPSLKAASHTDEVCYLFRCQKMTDYYKQIKVIKENDPDSLEALTSMKNIQALFYNFVKYGKPVHDGKPIQEFAPVQNSSKANQFNFIDVTNGGLVSGVAANAKRTEFLDTIVEKVKQLVKKHGETPKDTSLQQMCDAMKLGNW